MRISVVMIIGLALCGCGVEQQLTTSLIQENPDVDFKITEWLQKHGVDPTDVGSVQWYVNGLLAGKEVTYDLEVSEVATAVDNRAYSDGKTAIRRRVEVLSFSGYGVRDEEESTYEGSLFIFGNAKEVWVTLAWLVDDRMMPSEGYILPIEHSASSKRNNDYAETTIVCGCDKTGGTVNGAKCTDDNCYDLETCVRKKKDGTTENGSCAYVGMLFR